MSAEAPQLIRLAQFFEQRGVPSEPVLAAIIAANPARVYLAVSTRSPRIEVRLPYNAEALAAVAPTVAAPAIPPRSMLTIIAEGDQLRAALVVAGAIAPRAAVDELMPQAAVAWLEIVDAMTALGGGEINNRTRHLTEPARAAIAVMYPDRDASTEVGFVRGIDALATRLGLTAAQRALWARLHPTFGVGAGVSVSTECTAAGPAAHLRFLYSTPEWDQAIAVTKAIVEPAAALQIAVALGKISAELEADTLRGIELVFGDSDLPDVVCWVVPP